MPRRTKEGKKTALADVEDKLEGEYGSSKDGKAKTFGTLNKIGLMRGSKATPKGLRAAKAKGGGNGRHLPKVPSAARDMAMLRRRRPGMME